MQSLEASIRLCGQLRVALEGRSVEGELPARQGRLLFAYLVLQRGRAVRRDELVEALWPERAPRDPDAALNSVLARLRAVVGREHLPVRGPVRLLLGERAWVDVEVARAGPADAQRALDEGRAEEALELAGEALGIIEQPLLAEFERGWLDEHRRELTDLSAALVDVAVEAGLRLGGAALQRAELIARRGVEREPFRESAHAALMRVLAAKGDSAEALRVYEALRVRLRDELGASPSRSLVALHQRLLTDEPSPIPESATGSRPHFGGGDQEGGARRGGVRTGPRTARIPVPPTPTVGRDGDLLRLRESVGDPTARLVTVVGPGGVGKTRLAVELARAVAPELRDGAVFVSLAALDACEYVSSTIAHELAIELFAGESVEDALVRHLGDRELLLVLDNFEHVLDAAPLVADLLAGAPDVTVLATSREPLRVRAERLFRLDPLAVLTDRGDQGRSAEGTAPAVALFEAVARAKDPDFRLTEGDLVAVQEVCQRLDGLPLAIELAAGNLGLLSVSDLAERLGQGLEAIGPGPRDAPARQRTLGATLHWSHRLLTPAEQHTFAGLAVFAGGCTNEAAQFVTGASLPTLEALVAKNLVVTDHLRDGSVRLGTLETVREFARARLERCEDRDEVHRRHCEHYLALAERTQPELRRSESRALLAKLDRELHNFRAAITWALDHPAPILALLLASSLEPYLWRRHLVAEASSWLEAALALRADAVPPALRAVALNAYARTLIETSTIDKAEAAAREGLDLRRALDDRAGCAESLNSLCQVLLWAHRFDDAYRYATDAERVARESNSEQARVDALHNLARLAPTLEQRMAHAEQAAAAYRAAGNRRRLAELQSNLSYTAIIYGDHPLAQRLGDEAIAATEALDDPVGQAYAHGNTGLAAVLSCDAHRAREAFSRELRLILCHQHDRLLYEPLIGLAAVAATEGRDDLAATLHGAADAATLERHHPSVARQLEERVFAPARARLGEAWQAAYAAGARLERDQTIEVALRNVEPSPQAKHLPLERTRPGPRPQSARPSNIASRPDGDSVSAGDQAPRIPPRAQQ